MFCIHVSVHLHIPLNLEAKKYFDLAFHPEPSPPLPHSSYNFKNPSHRQAQAGAQCTNER